MNEMMSPADFAAVSGRNNDGMFGGNGAWWIIILFLFAFMGNGWGNGGRNSGAADNYVLASDFATVQRMISDATNTLERKLDNNQNGICDLGYAQAQLINGVQMGQMQQGYETRDAINGISRQLAECCCGVKQQIAETNYNLANQANGLSRAIERGFCDTNYNMQAQHNATMIAVEKVGDRVVDYLNSARMQDLQAENQALKLAASQAAQNNYLVNTLRPSPAPAYVVQNPYCCNGGGYGYGCGVA